MKVLIEGRYFNTVTRSHFNKRLLPIATRCKELHPGANLYLNDFKVYEVEQPDGPAMFYVLHNNNVFATWGTVETALLILRLVSEKKSKQIAELSAPKKEPEKKVITYYVPGTMSDSEAMNILKQYPGAYVPHAN